MMSSINNNNNNNNKNSGNSSSNSAPAPAFKEQLDNKAIESRIHDNESEGNSTLKTVVDAISQVIPASVPIIGSGSRSHQEKKGEDKEEEPAGPPHRPENDVQIEEFVREQHRSTIADNLTSGRE